MKIKLPAFMHTGWVLLTEVPGWADAPLSARLSRALPIVLPALGAVSLLIWNFGWQKPQANAERELLAPLVAVESEIATLQLVTSEQLTVELAERAGVAERLLLGSPDDLGPLLLSLKKEALDKGWEANFQKGEISAESTADESQISYLPVRGKLAPVPGNMEVYSSLLALLERFSTSGKRIDLMRLAIRADENKWQAVEVNLRLACLAVHEKTP